MGKEPRPLAEMQERAALIMAALSPFCERIETAGSVRRHKSMCADLELVAIPRMRPAGLFGDQQENALYVAIKGTLPWTWLKGDNPDGRYHQLQTPDGLQVDLFLAQPDNWGWLSLIRTGSADFSHAVLSRWKARQGIGPDGKGSVDGRLVTRHGDVVSTPEETDVFKAIGCHIVLPQHRTDGSVLRASR